MKIFFPFIILLIVLYGCQPEPPDQPPNPENTNPIRVDSSFISPVTEIKYYSNGSYFFEFADTGTYTFTADTIGNQFKINILLSKKNRGNPIANLVKFIYRYDTLYRLVKIERDDFSGAPIPSIKLFYTGQRLIRFEEWNANTLSTTYNVSHLAVAGGRELYIAPYTTTTGPTLLDTISHQLAFNSDGKVANIKERLRRTGNASQLWNQNFTIHYSNNDVEIKEGYEVYDSYGPGTPRKDSLRTGFLFTRPVNNNTLLPDYLEKIYGTDFYAILNNLNFLILHGGGISLFLLPGQNRAAESEVQYAAVVYTNGVQSSFQSSTHTSENIFDFQNRLIKSKVNSTPPNYYTWEIKYR